MMTVQLLQTLLTMIIKLEVEQFKANVIFKLIQLDKPFFVKQSVLFNVTNYGIKIIQFLCQYFYKNLTYFFILVPVQYTMA